MSETLENAQVTTEYCAWCKYYDNIKRIATTYCSTCGNFLCEDCKHDHERQYGAIQ